MGHLYLVEHAETPLGKRFHGELDPGLSEKGHHESTDLAILFKDKSIDTIAVPAVMRNAETALHLAAVTRAQIIVDDSLHTWRMPTWSGKPRDAVKQAQRTYLRRPGVKPPQGESADKYLARWKRTFLRYQGMARMTSKNIVLVLNSLSIGAVAGKFKTIDLDFVGAGAWLVGPDLKLEEL